MPSSMSETVMRQCPCAQLVDVEVCVKHETVLDIFA